MKIEKLQLSEEKVDINLKFYFFLKHIIKLKPSNNQINYIKEQIILFPTDKVMLINNIESIFKSLPKIEQIKEICLRFEHCIDVKLFNFSLSLYQIKGLLLEEAKTSENLDIHKLSGLNPLSRNYDKISVLKPYKRRVVGALLSLLFFEKLDSGDVNFMSKDSYKFICSLSEQFKIFKKYHLESNQVFMLMFNESMNQSIRSNSGSDYETRILSVLKDIGVDDIQKTHDEKDKSIEYDFLFKIDERVYGISAKRTLRERYKQFIKTTQTSDKVNIFIEITIGDDLNEEKAKIITNDGTYIFVSDEIYNSRDFLKKIDKVYSVNSLSLETLKGLN